MRQPATADKRSPKPATSAAPASRSQLPSESHRQESPRSNGPAAKAPEAPATQPPPVLVQRALPTPPWVRKSYSLYLVEAEGQGIKPD
jgi:hypothetical protein